MPTIDDNRAEAPMINALTSTCSPERPWCAAMRRRGSGYLGTVGLLSIMILVGACSLRQNTVLSFQAQNARTPKEHAAVADAYRERARDLRKESGEHKALAEWWASLAGGKTPATGTGRYEEAEHCRRLAANLAAAATEADALAGAHDRLAGQGTSH